MLRFETFRKRGRGWEYLGERDARDSRSAALQTGYVHHLRVVGIRVADTPGKLQVYRFIHVPELHHG